MSKKDKPNILKDDVLISYTDAELEKQWNEVVLNPEKLRKELQGHLDAWINGYEPFLSLPENAKRIYYEQMLARHEVYLHNHRLGFRSIGVIIEFDELNDYLKYKPLMSPDDVEQCNRLSYPKVIVKDNKDDEPIVEYEIEDFKVVNDRINEYIKFVFHREQQTHILEPISIVRGSPATYLWPRLDLLDIKITQDEVNELNEKCLQGVEVEVGDETRWKEFEITGKDKNIVNASNYSRYQTRWFDERFKRYNKTRDSHFTYVMNLLTKRKIIPMNELMNFMNVPQDRYKTQRIHQHLLNKMLASFKDWFAKKYKGKGWTLDTSYTNVGTQIKAERTIILTATEYHPSEPDEVIIPKSSSPKKPKD